MALQSSGQITLDDIHVEAGGATGTLATIDDTDIRALISATSGSEMEFADWYGASSSIATRTITAAFGQDSYLNWYVYGYDTGSYFNIGSISSSSFPSSPAGTIKTLIHQAGGSLGTNLELRMTGSGNSWGATSIFSTMSITGPTLNNGTQTETFNASSATFTAGDPTAIWTWSPTYVWFRTSTANAYSITWA